MLTQDRVRDAMIDCWARQSCRNPADWPGVLTRLIGGRDLTEHEAAEGINPARLIATGGGAYAERLSLAIAGLTEAFGSGAPQDDPTGTVLRAFPPFSRETAAEVAARLTAAARGREAA
jgi:hypothetical protein